MVSLEEVRTIEDNKEKVDTTEETKEEEKKFKVGKASHYLNQRFNYSSEDLFNQFIRGDKASLRGLFKNRATREQKIALAREFVWEVGLLYRIIQLKIDFITDGFRIYHEDEKVENTFKDLNEKLDIETYIKNAAFEHEVTGEWFPFLSWNGTDLSKLTILNPEQVSVKSLFGEDLIYLKPTDDIMKILNDPDEEVQKRIRKIVPPKYYDKWSKGREVLLDEEEVFRYYNQKAYHEGYSHSPIEPIFDDLALLSMYKESDYSIAYKIKKAILQIKVGNKDYNEGEPVDSDMIDAAEEMFKNPAESAEVITQWFMDAEWVIPDGDVYYPDKYQPVIRSILEWSGLGVVLSEKSSYSGADIRSQAFYKDIKSAREVIKKSVEEIYREIAKKKGMTTYGNKLKVPEVKFSNLALLSNEDMIESVRFLYKHGLLSPDTALDSFGFSFDEEYRIKSKDDKMEKYLETVTVPFEPSQDVNMRSFLRREQENNDNTDTQGEEEGEGNE